MLYKILLAFSMLFAVSESAFSQIKLPDVTGPIVRKLPILIHELSSVGKASPMGREFIEVLKNDLDNAALFDVVESRETIRDVNNINYQEFLDTGVDYLIAGQYRAGAGKVEFAVRLYNVREGRPVLGRSYDSSPGRVREAAHRFAGLVMEGVTGKKGFFTSKIAFVLGRKGNRDLFIMDYDGSNVLRLTKHNSLVMSPHCSPAGDKIVFNSDKIWDQDLYVATLHPRLSEKRLTRALRLEQSAEWSPSARLLAFSANGDIYVSGQSGKGAVNLTRSNSIDVSPTWSPDGSMIAFVSDRSGRPQIYVMRSNGKGLKKITSGGYSTDPSWSPNKKVNKIAFVKLERGTNVYIINPDGSGEQRLTFGSGRNENPSWSPDGYYLAFTSTRTAVKDIYMMYLNGENQVRLGRGGGKAFPTWCR